MDSTLLAAIIPLLVIWFGLIAYALLDLRTGSVRYLPKWAWAAIIVLVSFGSIIYLVAGRDNE